MNACRDQATSRRAAAALLGVVILSGCSHSPQVSSGSPSPSSASSSSSANPVATASPSPDATDAAGKQALDAYRGFRQAQVAAEAVADPHNADLARYAGDEALAQERTNLLQLNQAGIVVTGMPIFSPEVAAVAIGSSPLVTITDCVDTRGWTPVYKATGKSAAAPDQPIRVLATALARPYGEGWPITELTTERSRPC